ncbi:hypothetical protein BDW02DRAFT_56015 [Decorospora gaudefroyi]|uniref:Uncharacterized protein n=1 Tax=Decorospora gaudefroyi TaxID=184978 RepID=A0A6A5K5S3_9PLEO|nr:hypothetical protein BDW02DRAFT_56015 [Decorospora gaudefroyi]
MSKKTHIVDANLGVSGGIASKSTCDCGCARAANLGVSGGVAGKLTCDCGCARRLLTLVRLVV